MTIEKRLVVESREFTTSLGSSFGMRLSEGLGIFLQSMVGVRARSTVLYYQARLGSLMEFLGDVEVESISLNELRAWRANLATRETLYHGSEREKAGELSVFTLHQYVRCCRRFFNFLVEEEILRSSPARRLEFPRLPKRKPAGISWEGVERMLAAALHPRDRAMVLFLADSACRVGGLVNLNLERLDLRKRVAYVREKGDNERAVFFTERTFEALVEWLKVRPRCETGAVFVTWPDKQVKHERMTTSAVEHLLAAMAKRAGLTERANPHSFRHGAIRAMLDNGMTLPEASQIAGHSSVQVTGDIYGIVPVERLKRVHNATSWVARAGEDEPE